MIGNVIKPKSGDVEYPLVLTEAEFIEILNKGIYTRNLLGHQVTLTNSAAISGTNPNYMIVDVNHDSNQLNTYDLMAVDTVYYRTFGSSKNWRNCTLRTWLNGTFYSGFSSDIKLHIANIRYNSTGTIYNDDKIILPSITELFDDKFAHQYYTRNEGSIYPALPSYLKKYNSTNAVTYWTRTQLTNPNDYQCVWVCYDINYNLPFNDMSYASSFYVVPLFRVQ